MGTLIFSCGDLIPAYFWRVLSELLENLPAVVALWCVESDSGTDARIVHRSFDMIIVATKQRVNVFAVVSTQNIVILPDSSPKQGALLF